MKSMWYTGPTTATLASGQIHSSIDRTVEIRETITPFVPTGGRTSAAEYLRTAAETIEERGKLRDKPSGERSMARAVDAYNTLFGDAPMDETKGWQFMVLLKFARMAGGKYHEDDYIDAISYAALAAESANK